MIGLAICVLLALFIIYRLTKKNTYKLYYNKSSRIAPIVESMQCLKQPYRATPWLFSAHLHTVYGMQLRKSKRFDNERESVQYPDGGSAIIDWFHPPGSEGNLNIPIIVILHTLGGGSREKCVNCFGVSCAQRNFRAVVINCRGCGGAKFTSKRAYNALEVDDFKYVIDNHIKRRTTTDIFMVGFSMGAMHATEYATKYSDVTAVVAVSHTMNGPKGAKQLEEFPLNRLYLPAIMASHHRLMRKNTFLDMPELLKTKNMTELDTLYTAPSLGLSSCEEYWDKLSIYHRVPLFKVPILQLVSEDDPFTRKSYFPYQEALADANQNMVLVTTPEGGHVSFLTGLKGDKTIIEDIAIEWFMRCSNANR